MSPRTPKKASSKKKAPGRKKAAPKPQASAPEDKPKKALKKRKEPSPPPAVEAPPLLEAVAVPPPPHPPIGVGYIPRPSVEGRSDPAKKPALTLAQDGLPVFRLETTPTSLVEGWQKVVDLVAWDGPPDAWILFLFDNMEVSTEAIASIREVAQKHPKALVCLRGIVATTGARFGIDWWHWGPHHQLSYDDPPAGAYPYEAGFAAPVTVMSELLASFPPDKSGGFDRGTNVILSTVAAAHGVEVVLAKGTYRIDA